MNYYQARELENKEGKGRGLWHYTRMHDKQVHPIGNCAVGCRGHRSPQAAEKHQQEYVLTSARWTSLEFDKHKPNFCFTCDGESSGYWLLSAAPCSGERIYRCAKHTKVSAKDIPISQVTSSD